MRNDGILMAMMAGGGVAGVPLSNGSALSLECDTLSGWTQTYEGLGAGNQVTEGGESCFKLYDTGYNAANSTLLTKTSAFTPPAGFLVASFRMKHNKIDVQGNQPTINVQFNINTGGVTRIYSRLGTDNIRVPNDSADNELHAHTQTLTDFFWLTLAVTYTSSTAVADIYIGTASGYEQIATGVDVFSTTTGTEGEIRLSCTDRLNEATRPASFWDKIYMGDGFA